MNPDLGGIYDQLRILGRINLPDSSDIGLKIIIIIIVEMLVIS